jgi:titin
MPFPEISRRGSRVFRACAVLAFWLGAHSADAATFTVINTNDSGVGSFRAAISNANLTLGSNFIAFAITTSGKTIKPNSPFQLVSNALTIDATTQTNYAGTPLVELNGTNAGGSGFSGIFIVGSNCTVRGLCINRFSGDGIRLEGAGSNVVQANFLGTDLTGTNAAPNGWGNLGQGGVNMLSPFNLIGGTSATNRNVISGNYDSGVLLLNTGAGGNLIQGNFIGCDPTGTKRVPNSTNGVLLANASSNVIGGTVAGARNLISGNGGLGMNFLQSCNGNLVQGNFIGANATGTSALSNGAAGILLFAVSSGPQFNLIGGTNAAARNLISGNGTDGVVINGTTVRNNQIAGNYIGTSSNGLAKIPNGGVGVNLTTTVSNLVGGATAAAGNVISGNGFSGVLIGPLSLVVGNVVQNNFIGADATGTNALGNGTYGVTVIKANANTIGPGNVISGNPQSGLLLTSNAANNRVTGNFIGTDASGTRSLGNAQFGVLLEATANTIGGANVSDRNLISGNTNSGVFFNGAVASNNFVLGNFIGTDVSGTSALKNFAQGLRLDNAPGNTIGSSAARNIISGNGLAGILIQSNLASANVIQGNYLGTDLNGTLSLPNGTTLLTYTNASGNPTNNPGGGIDITAAPGTVIGGANPGEGNLIAANWRDAISIGDTGASNSVIQGNLIGVTATLGALGNEWNGVELRTDGGCVGTIIAGNVLANARLSQRSGVRVRNLVSGVFGNTNVLISGNAIYHNGGVGSYSGLGISLDAKSAPLSPTVNDSCDSDIGANNLQNYPVLTTAYCDGTRLYVAGTFNSASGQTFTLEFFTNALDASTTFYQGESFAGFTNVTTASCAAGNFALVLPVPALPGQRITATATDANNNTSELSLPVAVTATPTLVASVPTTNLTQLTLAWPTNLAGFALKQTTNLLPVIVWNSVTNSAITSGTNYSVTVTRTNGQRFFRLAFP